jgi:hypothetical protein
LALTKVTSGIIEDGTIVNADLSSSIAVTGGQLADDAITTAKILDDNVTIAKISGSAAAAADTFLKKDGTWSTVASGIDWQAVQTTGFTAVAEKGYPCNTTAGAFTVTLPASASVGDQISIVDYAGTFDTYRLELDPNGLKIKGATASLVANTEREGITLTYVDVTQGWIVTSGVNTGDPALSPVTYSADFLVIAGGGGGGTGGGGNGGAGAAGGYRNSFNSEASGGGGSSEASLTFTSGTVYTVTIGAGSAADVKGIDSSLSGSGITTITSVGGGEGGAYNNQVGGNGGSGGGGSQTSQVGGSGTANQGYGGGQAGVAGGGGGGASAVGTNQAGYGVAGNGGNGLASSITGAAVTRAGGGGGSNHSAAGSQGGIGGTGGGGNGRYGGTHATAGTVNTGSGGGGQGESVGIAAAGGSGVVILSILDAYYSGTTTGSPTVATGVSGRTVLTFNGTGSYTG